MKIVTYNVNGLRSRISQHGSLLKLLESLDADIVCFQETKLSRRDLATDVTTAKGYEAFFSCTRTLDKGRICYSGVATFCRVNSLHSSCEVALPLAAEEGITRLLEYHRQQRPLERDAFLEGLDDVSTNDLMKVDNEGRCVVTDHGHFVLFNLYGPRAQDDDEERLRYKSLFFLILQKRWEYLLREGKNVVVVGDFNIAPTALDRCDAKPDFEENRFRKWFRSMLVEHGGPFHDCFRLKHPNRREAYTCWAQDVGAEEFNYGSRIDHIIISGKCFHSNDDVARHSFIECHVEDCDIMIQFRRGKLDNIPKWKGGRSVKLEGSDHAPVYVLLKNVPDLPLHRIPPFAVRYAPEVRGLQQTIESVLTRRQASLHTKPSDHNISHKLSIDMDVLDSNCNKNGSSSRQLMGSENDQVVGENIPATTSETFSEVNLLTFECSRRNINTSNKERIPTSIAVIAKKKKSFSQKSILSFFSQSKTLSSSDDVCCSSSISYPEVDVAETKYECSQETQDMNIAMASLERDENMTIDGKDGTEIALDSGDHNPEIKQFLEDSSNMALSKWKEIQQKMHSSLPLCKGHGEPCVVRSVKKTGPNLGRGFYVCARAKGPASNPEANCNYFKWASSKPK